MARRGPGGRVAAVLAGVVAALAGVAVSVVLVAGPAAAHDELTGTDPADGATVDVAPDRVTLTFTEPALQLGTQVQVTGPDGTVVSEGEPVLEGSTVAQSLAATRPAGAYRVDWRVTSEDGHPVTGSFGFTAAAATGLAPTTDPTTAPTTDPATVPAGDPTTAAASAAPVVEPTPPTPEPTIEATPISVPSDPAAPAGAGRGRNALIAGAVLVVVVAVLVAATAGRRASLRRKRTGG